MKHRWTFTALGPRLKVICSCKMEFVLYMPSSTCTSKIICISTVQQKLEVEEYIMRIVLRTVIEQEA